MFSRCGSVMLLVLTSASLATVCAADIERRSRHPTQAEQTDGNFARKCIPARSGSVKPAPAKDNDPLAFERTHVVVYLEGPLSPEPVTATLEQKNRRFIPDLLVVPTGSIVSFPNRDPIFHNVFSLSAPKTFDLGNYSKDQTRTVTLSKPGVVYVNCHLHPNMSAAIVVTPNRWSTRPDASGRFLLSDVPVGKHKIVAWHKAAGFFRQTVDVRPGGTPTVSFLIPFDEDGVVAIASEK